MRISPNLKWVCTSLKLTGFQPLFCEEAFSVPRRRIWVTLQVPCGFRGRNFKESLCWLMSQRGHGICCHTLRMQPLLVTLVHTHVRAHTHNPIYLRKSVKIPCNPVRFSQPVLPEWFSSASRTALGSQGSSSGLQEKLLLLFSLVVIFLKKILLLNIVKTSREYTDREQSGDWSIILSRVAHTEARSDSTHRSKLTNSFITVRVWNSRSLKKKVLQNPKTILRGGKKSQFETLESSIVRPYFP